MHKTSGSDKAGKIPLIYSLKLRKKYIKYLKSKNFYLSSTLIAHSNFHLNKKHHFIGIFLRIFAFIFAPILIRNFFTKKFKNLHFKR